MKPGLIARAGLALLLLLCCSAPAWADAGPKPSVTVDFQGLEQESYFATLLAEESSTGPWSSDNAYEEWCGDREAFLAFQAYQDADGYFFLGHIDDCTADNRFVWTYYPPHRFKILLYFPAQQQLILCPGRYERYAFDSYFRVDAAALELNDPTGTTGQINVSRSYDLGCQLWALLGRMILTLGVELALALVFALGTRRQLKLILLTNLVTQGLLNIALNLINYQWGPLAYILNYTWLELLVLTTEGLIYVRLLGPRAAAPVSKKRLWLYALCANLTSLLAGLMTVRWLPSLF